MEIFPNTIWNIKRVCYPGTLCWILSKETSVFSLQIGFPCVLQCPLPYRVESIRVSLVENRSIRGSVVNFFTQKYKLHFDFSFHTVKQD
jgi:hypothetical protein